MAAKPRVFSIPASVPFLPTLIAALAEGRLVPGFPQRRDPLAFASATLYLPTRRACRLARDEFLGAIGGEAAILPRVVPIGDIDEDEIAFANAAAGTIAAEALALPEALGSFERRILLAELVMKWAESPEMRIEGGASLVAHNPAAALSLADDLARLMDDMTTRQVGWERIDRLVPDDLDEYWQKTLRFLKIARENWPALLAELGKIEPAARRDLLIEAERRRLAATDGPVIAAGSTGSMPSTAALLETISKLPRGAVVLPGLDTDLDQPAWDAIDGDGEDGHGFGHPQHAMQALLRRLGIVREDVTPLAAPAAHGRERLASEALRPASATDHWKTNLVDDGFAVHVDAAVSGIAMIEAGNAEEEALAVAVALREAVTEPDRTAALVTPDRALARRVLAALARWKIAADDSGGDKLADTPAGVFARLAAKAALHGLEPVTLLALLKHPLFGLPCRGRPGRAIAALELAILRGPRPKAGSRGLAHALSSFRGELDKFRRRDPSSTLHRSDPRVEISDFELDAADELVRQLAAALAPLEELEAHELPFADIAAHHRAVIETLRGGDDRVSGPDDEALAAVFDDIAAYATLKVTPNDYVELFEVALADKQVRRPEANVRVRIYGPLEARLTSADRVVLGGLVEGVWPPETPADPWLSRPMRHALGLDLPERRIGLSAHDFAQALGHREVILTRTGRREGAPTVPSRFVQRLAAVAGGARWKEALARGEKYLEWARALDQPREIRPIKCPAPTPPLDVRPKQLSVTEIENWLRDPYTIYAKHVLDLQPLDAVDTPPGAADRGTVIHAAIGAFTQTYVDGLPGDPTTALIEIGERAFAALADYPEARAFWWPRFLRIARWFARYEANRRVGVRKLHTEINGRLEIPFGAQTFKLSARADRIEARDDGYAIVDYKTGKPPTEPQVRTGLSPQLTLEAAMLRGGAFDGIAAGGTVTELTYVALRGGEPPGEEKEIRFEKSSPEAQADHALKRLTDVVARFADAATPYRSLVHPMWKRRGYGPYDHLARVKEWLLAEEIEDE
jgi:ATP-dependent helicase/nuclease subunit B